MAIISAQDVKAFLKNIQGKEITLTQLRKEFRITPDNKSFDAVRNILFQLAEQKIVRPSGKKDGVYKVVTQVKPVQVFGVTREMRDPFTLIFPKDFVTGMEFPFAEDIVIRDGDLILISGLSNYGKTALALNFCGENINQKPVLMGNEYTTSDLEPTPRFLKRLHDMEWIDWKDDEGMDKFTLLPVWDDYAEHIIKDRINIIDWINIETGEHYMIGTILSGIKRQLGKGIAIIAIQKAEGAETGRGGQFTKDFTDCEILIDKFSDTETLLKIGKVKEYNRQVVGKTYAFGIFQGVRIENFREVKKCPKCFGKKYYSGKTCDNCTGRGMVDS